MATIPSQHPTPGTGYQPQLQALPLAQHVTPKPCSPITLHSFLPHTEEAHFHPCVSCLEMKVSKSLWSTHGCRYAPLAQSRKEDAEAGTAGWASASDK